MPSIVDYAAWKRKGTVSGRAVALWSARSYDGVRDCLLDLSGNGLHARLGSAVGADSNDPLRLGYVGKRVYFPGAANNYVSKPSAASDDFPGDTEYICQVYANWGTDSGHLRSRWSVGASYAYRYTATQVQAWFRVGGVDYFPIVNHGFSANYAIKWIRIRRVAATGTVSFASSNDGVTYSAMGTDQATIAGALTSAAGTQVYIGCETTSAGLQTGSVMYDEARNGIGGTVVSSFNAALLSEPYASYTDPQGNVWTLNRSTSGRKLCVVDRDLLLLGTDDYLEVADSPLLNFGAGESLSAVLLGRIYGAPTGYGISKKSGGVGTATQGYAFAFINGLYSTIRDGSTENAISNSPALAVGTMKLGALVVSPAKIINYVDGVTPAELTRTAGSLSNSEALRIGRLSGVGTAYNDMELCGGALFRQPLTIADLVRLKQEMLAR